MWRIPLVSILLLLSLLVLFKAPTNFFWRVAVAVTEFPYVFIAVSLISFFFCLKAERYKALLLVLNIITIFFYFLPVISAYLRSMWLENELSDVFPYKEQETQLKEPYSFLKMFSGIGIKDVSPTIFLYKKSPGKDLNLDFYSGGEKKLPCVIVIHGGSWSAGDSRQLPDLNSYLANRNYHVAAINYRLAPEFQSPAPVEDVRDALAFLSSKSDELHIDTSNFVLVGRSAGGQIALLTAYTSENKNIKGVVSFYAPADMVWGGRIKVSKLVLNTEKVFAEYLGGSIDEVPQKFTEASSCEFVRPNSPPTLLIHGKLDAMVAYEHSNRLVKKLKDNRVKHYFLNLPRATHGCDYNINGPSGQLSTFAVERFINSVTSN